MGLTVKGKNKSPVPLVPKTTAVDIASGNDHLVILANNGVVITMGCAEQGQLGRVTARTLTGESRRGTKTLLTPGTVLMKAKPLHASAIWATPFCTFLRESNTGAVYGFGLNNYNQLGVKKSSQEFEHFPGLSQFKNVKAIAGGQHHTIVLTDDSKVYAIGRRDYGRLGLGDIGHDLEELQHIKTLTDVVDIKCGESNSFAITKDGKPYVWGMGTNSQLGTGDENDVPEPRLLATAQVKEKNILSISGGGQHSLFLVEVPESTAKVVKAPEVTAKAPAAEVSSTEAPASNSEAAPKENGTPQKPAARAPRNKRAGSPIIMESDSTTDVNGNSEKDEKMEVDSGAAKRVRKRKT